MTPTTIFTRQALFSVRVSAAAHAGLVGAGIVWSLWASPVHVHMRRGTAVWEASFSLPEPASEAEAVVFLPAESAVQPLSRMEEVAAAATALSRRPPVETLLAQAILPPAPHALEDCDCPAHEKQLATPKTPPTKAQPATPTLNKSAPPPRPRAAAEFTVSTAATLPASAATAGLEVDDPPRGMSANPPPPYPNEAYARRQEGRVLLEVRVAADGSVETLRVMQSSGVATLDQSALNTVRGWRFEPARRAGKIVAATVNVPIRFSLAGR